MWIAVIFSFLLGLHCTVSTSPPSPTNLSFSSVNLRNVLQWVPGSNTPDDTLFTVEYAIYGQSTAGRKGRRVYWRAVQKCTEIVRTWCDLSSETEDEEQGYNARVRALSGRTSSKWALTQRRFDPKSETTFGPPSVSVEIKNNSAIITLKGPMRYRSKKQSSGLSLAAIYPQMTYNLSINNTNRNLMHHVPVVASPYKYRLMDYSMQYCFSAQSRFLYMPIQCQSSAWVCITTPPDPVIEELRRVVMCTVVPVLCFGVIAVASYILYQYLTGKGQKSPYILKLPSFHSPPVSFSPENQIPISIIEKEPLPNPISTSSEPVCSKQLRCIADSPPSYSPQRPEADLEEPLDDSSAEYGAVSAAPMINADGERRRGEEAAEGQTCPDGDSSGREECAAVDFPTTGVSAQQMCYRLQNSQMHSQTDTRQFLQACTSSHMTPVLPSQSHLPSQSSQNSSTGEDSREEKKKEEEKVSPGLFLDRNPQIGLFKGFEHLENDREAREGDLGVNGQQLDGGADEGNNPENIPLLSACASHSTPRMPPSSPYSFDYLPNAYAVLTSGASQESEEEDYYYYYEEELGSVCVDWDPMTRKLVLPEGQTKYKEEGSDGRRELEEGSECRGGGGDKGEESHVTMGGLRFESVYVRQGSEEEAEARREAERGGETEWEVEDVLRKWKLSISTGE